MCSKLEARKKKDQVDNDTMMPPLLVGEPTGPEQNPEDIDQQQNDNGIEHPADLHIQGQGHDNTGSKWPEDPDKR